MAYFKGRQLRKLFGISLGLTASLIMTQPSFGSIPPSPELKGDLPTSTSSLSETIKLGLSSLRSASLEVQNHFDRIARLYAKTRHDTATRSERNEFASECVKNEADPFCTLSQEYERKVPFSALRVRLRRSISFFRKQQVKGWILNSNLPRLVGASEHEIRMALKGLSSYSSISRISSELASSSSCSNSGLGLLLGMKGEESLPDPEIRKSLIQLYEKVAHCDRGETGLSARFRVSLMYLWDNRCEAAQLHLNYLAIHATDSDYQSRALYWQYQCAKQFKDNKTATQSLDDLYQKYPFSLHTLLAQRENPGSKLPMPMKADSQVKFQTEGNLRVNGRIRATEALLSINEPALAKEVMNSIVSDFDRESPLFRLYAVVLFDRMHSYQRNFKLLTSIFRDSPDSISKAALELYYPRNTQLIHSIGGSDLDHLLLLSLIRQESAFNVKAKSPAGALGLMQVMPNTARRFGHLRRSEKLLDPDVNLKIGSRYFASLLNHYSGDASLAIAAYNAGERRIDQWVERYPVKNRLLFLDLIPFHETRNYVSSIARNYFWYLALYPGNFPKTQEFQENRKVALRSLERMFRLLGT